MQNYITSLYHYSEYRQPSSRNMADEEGDSSEDSTDAFSVKFDPLKALYSDKVRVPVPEAPLFDNLSKFESVVLKGHANKPNVSEAHQTKEASNCVRNFLPHQVPIQKTDSDRLERYSEKNVISRMHKYLGPLAALYDYMENKTRVKVYTRNASGIRGHVEAYIAAFDKHWNLALEDCLEIWKRKIKKKVPALGDLTYQECSKPKVIVKKVNKMIESLERHVPQLLLRGEQVVLIVKINE